MHLASVCGAVESRQACSETPDLKTKDAVQARAGVCGEIKDVCFAAASLAADRLLGLASFCCLAGSDLLSKDCRCCVCAQSLAVLGEFAW